MIPIFLSQLASIVQGKCMHGDAEITGLSIDSRAVKPGDLFIAIVGKRSDGHDFLQQVQASGASAACVNRPVPDVTLPQLCVADTLQALGQFGQHCRTCNDCPLIAITGSNGKSTIKNMVAAIFQQTGKPYLATKGNLNTDIGLPLNLCQLAPSHRYVILEMGMSHLGEIAYLSHMAQPDVAAISNAYPAHLAGVGHTVAGVAQAKGEIFEGLRPGGTAVLNADDDFCDYWRELAGDHPCVTFGLSSKADISARQLQLDAQGSTFVMRTPQGGIPITLTVPGRHNVQNALMAAATCLLVGIDLPTIQAGLKEAQSASHRMERVVTPGGTVVLDDTYNANPASLRAALDTLHLSPGKKILVLGDMKELGREEVLWHQQAGEAAKQAGIDQLFAVGSLALSSVQAFGPHAQHFESQDDLFATLLPECDSHTVVLVKGSRSMHMERIVERLCVA